MCDCAKGRKVIDARGASLARSAGKPRAITVGHEVAGYVDGKPHYRQVSYDSDGKSRPTGQ